jgi:hypothetical protein
VEGGGGGGKVQPKIWAKALKKCEKRRLRGILLAQSITVVEMTILFIRCVCEDNVGRLAAQKAV